MVHPWGPTPWVVPAVVDPGDLPLHVLGIHVPLGPRRSKDPLRREGLLCQCRLGELPGVSTAARSRGRDREFHGPAVTASAAVRSVRSRLVGWTRLAGELRLSLAMTKSLVTYLV